MFRQWLVSAVEAQSDHSQDRILGLFDALHDRFASEGYYGCAFVRASVEYPAPGYPVHRSAREHKEMIRSYLRGLAAEVEGADSMTLSEQLYLLFEGAIECGAHGRSRRARPVRNPVAYRAPVARHILYRMTRTMRKPTIALGIAFDVAVFPPAAQTK